MKSYSRLKIQNNGQKCSNILLRAINLLWALMTITFTSIRLMEINILFLPHVEAINPLLPISIGQLMAKLSRVIVVPINTCSLRLLMASKSLVEPRKLETSHGQHIQSNQDGGCKVFSHQLPVEIMSMALIETKQKIRQLQEMIGDLLICIEILA